MPRRDPRQRAESIFHQAGGILRTRDALARGIHPRTLYALRDTGHLEALGRGIYHLVDAPVTEKLDVALVTARLPKGVLCLVSAPAWHGLPTQLPREVQIALPVGRRLPRPRFPPVRVFWFAPRAHHPGLERH